MTSDADDEERILDIELISEDDEELEYSTVYADEQYFYVNNKTSIPRNKFEPLVYSFAKECEKIGLLTYLGDLITCRFFLEQYGDDNNPLYREFHK